MKAETPDNDIRLKIVGRFLQERRIKAKLTQADVAKSLRYTSPQFISNWERGVSLPPLSALPRIASLYGIQPRELITVMERYQEVVLKLQRKALQDAFKEAQRASG